MKVNNYPFAPRRLVLLRVSFKAMGICGLSYPWRLRVLNRGDSPGLLSSCCLLHLAFYPLVVVCLLDPYLAAAAAKPPLVELLLLCLVAPRRESWQKSDSSDNEFEVCLSRLNLPREVRMRESPTLTDDGLTVGFKDCIIGANGCWGYLLWRSPFLARCILWRGFYCEKFSATICTTRDAAL